MATAQLMGAATGRIQVGTWIANIYVRHSYACAQGAALIADATDGRFVLGLGVSHPPVNQALGIDMGDAPSALRRYVTAVRSWLRGEGPATHLPQKPSVRPVPLYVAAITSRTVELAGELADGIMPFLWSADRVKKSAAWVDRGRAKTSGLGKVDIAHREPDADRRDRDVEGQLEGATHARPAVPDAPASGRPPGACVPPCASSCAGRRAGGW